MLMTACPRVKRVFVTACPGTSVAWRDQICVPFRVRCPARVCAGLACV